MFTITTENVEIFAIEGLYDYNFCLVQKYVEDYVDAEVIFFHRQYMNEYAKIGKTIY
jgi:hypothetical protein